MFPFLIKRNNSWCYSFSAKYNKAYKASKKQTEQPETVGSTSTDDEQPRKRSKPNRFTPDNSDNDEDEEGLLNSSVEEPKRKLPPRKRVATSSDSEDEVDDTDVRAAVQKILKSKGKKKDWANGKMESDGKKEEKLKSVDEVSKLIAQCRSPKKANAATSSRSGISSSRAKSSRKSPVKSLDKSKSGNAGSSRDKSRTMQHDKSPGKSFTKSPGKSSPGKSFTKSPGKSPEDISKNLFHGKAL